MTDQIIRQLVPGKLYQIMRGDAQGGPFRVRHDFDNWASDTGVELPIGTVILFIEYVPSVAINPAVVSIRFICGDQIYKTNRFNTDINFCFAEYSDGISPPTVKDKKHGQD